MPLRVGVSPWSGYVYRSNFRDDAVLSGKRTIHIAKELRFPHFFEGCVLLSKCIVHVVCVCVCVRLRLHVCECWSFPT